MSFPTRHHPDGPLCRAARQGRSGRSRWPWLILGAAGVPLAMMAIAGGLESRWAGAGRGLYAAGQSILLVLIVVLSVAAGIMLGAYPGQLARRRGHPSWEAIRFLGWAGLVTGGLLWAVAVAWALTSSPSRPTRTIKQQGDLP